MTDFIRTYLAKRLLDVGDNEDRLTQLLSAAETLADEFKADPVLLLQFLRTTLVSLVDRDGHVLTKIESLIEADRPTFVSFEPDRQLPILAAVGWQAVVVATDEDPKMAQAVWFGAVNLLRKGEIDAVSEPAIEFLTKLAQIVESAAIEEWSSLPPTANKSVKTIGDPDEPFNTLSYFKCAAANVEEDGTAIKNGNPNPPTTVGPWGAHFARYASSGVSKALKQYGAAIIEVVKASFDDLNKKFGALRSDMIRSHRAQSRRTELLWLAQSCYSASAQKSYREVSANEAIMLVAYDVAAIAEGISPQSIEYFVAETVEKIVGSKSIKVEQFIKSLAKSQGTAAIPDVVMEPLEHCDRIGVFEFLGGLKNGDLKVSDLEARTGFTKTQAEPPAELARWLYREIKSAECSRGEIWT